MFDEEEQNETISTTRSFYRNPKFIVLISVYVTNNIREKINQFWLAKSSTVQV